MNLRFTVMGNPIAKKRPKFARRGKFTMAYNPQESEEGRFMWEIKAQLAGDTYTLMGLPIAKGVPVELVCAFYFPIPVSEKKILRAVMAGDPILHTKKPDADNCVKFVKDCFNQLIWADDGQVAKLHAEKYYAVQPRTEIRVTTL